MSPRETMKSPAKRNKKSSNIIVVQDLARAAHSAPITEAPRYSQVEASRLENQTKIFASMCPDEVLDYYDNYETRSYHTTLMLGDVSGFTELTEKYTKSGKGGPSKLTETLNSYIGAMVQEILSHGGDVVKFSGDAFIVMWKLESGRVMRDIASEAIKTACIIQKHFGTYDTEVDVTLRVKLAIASGKTYFSPIGEPDLASYYIITGNPVWEVKFAEGLCRGGDILVTPSCWQWINPNDYMYEVLPDGVHTLIISLSVLWEDAKDLYSDGKSERASTISSSSSSAGINSNYATSTASTTSHYYRPVFSDDENVTENVTDYSLRPKVIKASRARLCNELRSFMVRPVIRSVGLDEPLEYLTEIRQVVIVFVNVITENTNRKTLVKLVNATFLFVCSIVGEMQGCVNKTSLFDKDLMFLCVFGLRGDKHELESQIGLRCASKLRRGLIKFQHIKTVTVGVTTGMTYCGVVGHVLRREYTVIGMAVNKAARLMCAYVDKVVCDRESFLLSHLEAKHFILQEAKHLKGISNVGPIYEFSEQSTYYDHELAVNKYPLLGRDAELRFFRETLGKLLGEELVGEDEDGSVIVASANESNVLIVRGEPRMGKTRLFEEMANVAPSHLPVNFISLAPYDKQIPFTLLRLLFCTPLDISDDSSVLEKQAKLAAHFTDERELLGALNHVFGVEFKLESAYTELPEKDRRKLLKKLVGQLTRSCFAQLWLIVVDDAELADEESLALLNSVIRQRNAMFVMGYGNKLSKSYEAPRKIFDSAQKIDLPGLDRWFQAGVACQVLEVVAIPADLEKVIQETSSGNPGWIESYLISLLQSSGISLRSMTREQIRDMGLVTPPVHMLQRSPAEAKMARGDRHNRWEMYQSSFKESGENGAKDSNGAAHYAACILTSEFTVEESIETTMDTILLRLYDSLTPLDQFLLKCASVLGEIIDRKMLEKLLHGTSQRDIGLSLVKLFELRIIGCAVGDFSRSAGPAVLFKRIHDPNLNTQIRCGCRAVDVPPVLADLPVYAACGLMRFKLTMFRETTYSLLTENQKVEAHSKALLYLRQKTRRCASCGGEQFARLLGESTLNEIGKRRLTEALQADQSNERRSSVLSDTDDLIAFLNSSRAMELRESQSRTNSLTLLRLCRPLEKSPTRTFSDVDFADCECNLLLLTAYTHIVQHCRGIGVNELTLIAILEFTEVCLSTLNVPQATKLLSEGEQLIDLIYIPPEDQLIVFPYLKGKIQTLRGRCFLESGLISEAMRCFDTTLEIMGYKFPTNPLMIRLKTMRLLKQQKLMFTCLRRLKVGALKGDAAHYNDQFASCLAHMFVVYRLKGMQDHARLAAVWGLNVALESSKDFLVLCTSYANMLITAHNYQYKSLIQYLDTAAINLCSQREDCAIELQELNAIAELYTRIFFSRWLRCTIESASRIGFIAARMANAIRSVSLKLVILPRIAQLLISGSRYGESVAMLQELEFISVNDMDQSGRAWYYALSVDLLLESGISLVTRKDCEQFYQRESGKMLNLRDTEATDRFFTCMWLWYVRIGNWEAAAVWRSRMADVNAPDKYTVLAAVTILKKLEGLITCYVFKLDSKNATSAKRILADIKETFKIVENLYRVVMIVYPRYLVVKGYYQMVRHRTKSGMALLQEAKRLSKEIGNITIYKWADHCEKAWTGTLSQLQRDFWIEQCTMDKQVDWHEVDLQHRKILPYALKLPNDRYN